MGAEVLATVQDSDGRGLGSATFRKTVKPEVEAIATVVIESTAAAAAAAARKRRMKVRSAALAATYVKRFPSVLDGDASVCSRNISSSTSSKELNEEEEEKDSSLSKQVRKRRKIHDQQDGKQPQEKKKKKYDVLVEEQVGADQNESNVTQKDDHPAPVSFCNKSRNSARFSSDLLASIRGVKKDARYDPGVPMTKAELVTWRREARRVRNRESASVSRQKTKGRITELELEVDTLRSKYSAALQKIIDLEAATTASAVEAQQRHIATTTTTTQQNSSAFSPYVPNSFLHGSSPSHQSTMGDHPPPYGHPSRLLTTTTASVARMAPPRSDASDKISPPTPLWGLPMSVSPPVSPLTLPQVVELPLSNTNHPFPDMPDLYHPYEHDRVHRTTTVGLLDLEPIRLVDDNDEDNGNDNSSNRCWGSPSSSSATTTTTTTSTTTMYTSQQQRPEDHYPMQQNQYLHHPHLTNYQHIIHPIDRPDA